MLSEINIFSLSARYTPVHPQERTKPILFCSWNLSDYEKPFSKWPASKLVELHFRLQLSF